MPADGAGIETNSLSPGAQHHFSIKQLPIPLGNHIKAGVSLMWSQVLYNH